MIDYNCLDLLGHRRLSTIPVHFARYEVTLETVVRCGTEIVAWITSKLQSRFSMILTTVLTKDKQLTTRWVVGFEDHSELTYFVLACPYLRN